MAQKVLQENVVRGNQAGRIVERDDGSKVFLVGNTRGEVSSPTPSSGGGSNEQAAADAARQAAMSAASENRQAMERLMAEQRAREEAALRETEAQGQAAIGQFRNVVSGLEKPTEIFGRLEEEKGLPLQQEQTRNLRQRLAEAEEFLGRLPGDVTERTAGTLTTEAQRNRIVAKEQVPITQNLQALARNLGIQETALAETINSITNQVQMEIAAQERTIEPERLNVAAVSQNADRRLSVLTQQAARELTGFSTARQGELDVLLQTLAEKGQIATESYRQAAELARQELLWEQTEKQLRLESKLRMGETKQEQGLLASREQALTGQKGQQELEQLQIQESGDTQRTVLGESGANYRTLLELNQSNEPPTSIQEVKALMAEGMTFQEAMDRVFPKKTTSGSSASSILGVGD